jgi:phage terminase large subunit-like protein
MMTTTRRAMMMTTGDAALRLLSGLVLEDGRAWGEAAEPVQLADARAVLDPDPLTPPNFFLTRPRGFSKTSDLAGVNVAVLLEQLPAGSRTYAVAADRDQGRLLVDSVAGFCERTPGLAGALTVDSYKVTANRTGSVLEVLAADSASAWGLRPAFVTVDEFAQWRDTREPKAMWRAIISALGKVAGARLVVMTSAGDPAHWSYRVLEGARLSPEWRVSEVVGSVPWVSGRWLAEQRRLLPEWEFQRLHENRWVGADDRLASVEDLQACVSLDGPQLPARGVEYVVGVDLGLTRDRAVAALCHAEPLGDGVVSGPVPGERRSLVRSRMVGFGLSSPLSLDGLGRVEAPKARPVKVVLDRMQTWQGSRRSPVQLQDVETWLLQAWSSFNRPVCVFDPWQSAGLAQRLKGQGVKCQDFVFTAQSVGRLASTLHLLVRDHALALPDDAELLEELANVRLRESSVPGVMRMDHDAGRHDDRATALAIAAQALLSRPVSVDWSPQPYRNLALRGTR